MATAAAQKSTTLTAVCTHELPATPVTYGRPWPETVQAAGPDTPSHYDVWKVGDLYPTTLQGVIPTDITLYNFGKYVESEDVLRFLESEGMETVNPREALAVAEHNPTLNAVLEVDYMGIISLETCSFKGESYVVSAWFDKAERKGYLDWFDYRWDSYCWFAAKPKAQV